MIFVRKERTVDVARHFRVTAAPITILVKRIREKPALLSELISRRDEKKAKREEIVTAVQRLVDRHEIIDSAASVAARLKEQDQIVARPELVRRVMHEDLGLRWRKVKEVSLHENSARNLVLRQRFAMALLEAAQAKTRLINIDETWLGMEDFRRMKWQVPGTTNSVAKKLWSPRISLILAVDNYGESYIALS